jgi:hypothetical protein
LFVDRNQPLAHRKFIFLPSALLCFLRKACKVDGGAMSEFFVI